MDFLAGRSYLYGMLARVVPMVVMIAVAVMALATPVHAVRMTMASGPDHAIHAAQMIHAPDDVDVLCHESDRHCGYGDAGACEFVCSALSAALTLPVAHAGQASRHVIHELASCADRVGHVPGLNEHPPRLRLL